MDRDTILPASARTPEQAQATMRFLLGLRERGIANVGLLRALEMLPREHFVPHRHADLAWRDIALPIPCGQTMPEPYLVARMVEALGVRAQDRVLEIGTGNGYSAAILSKLAREVVSVEIFQVLAVAAATRLASLGLANVHVLHGDGLALTEDMGLFDRILIQGSLPEVPASVLERLAEGGAIVYGEAQEGVAGTDLMRLSHGPQGFVRERVGSCRMQRLLVHPQPPASGPI